MAAVLTVEYVPLYSILLALPCMLFVVFCSHLLIVLIVLCSSLVTCILCPNHYICSFMNIAPFIITIHMFGICYS